MADSPCLEAAFAAARIFTKALDKSQVRDVMNELQGRANSLMQQGAERSDAFSQARKAMLEDKHDLYRRIKTQVVSSLLKNEARIAKIKDRIKGLEGAKATNVIIRTLKEMLDSSKRFNEGEGLSLQNHITTEEGKTIGSLISIFKNYKAKTGQDIKHVEDVDLANSVQYARDEASIKQGVRLSKITSVKPEDKNIQELGQEIYEHQEISRRTNNRYGSYRRPLRNYIHGNKMDRRKMLQWGKKGILEKSLKENYIPMLDEKAQATFKTPQFQFIAKTMLDADKREAFFKGSKVRLTASRAFPFWLSDMSNKLDLFDTFRGIKPYKEDGTLTDEMLHTLWDTFRNFIHPPASKGDMSFLLVNPEEKEDIEPITLKKSRFLFKSEEHRHLHFIDPAATVDSTKKWGGMSTYEAISMDASRMGKELGILKWGGGSPEQGWEDLLNHVNKEMGVDRHKLDRLTERFNILMGNIPHQDGVVSEISQGLMTWQNFDKLGLVTPSSLPDSATLTTALMNFGTRNPFDLIRNHIVSSISSYTGKVEKDYQHIFDLVGVGADHLRSDLVINARAGQTWNLKDGSSKMNASIFKWGLLVHHDDQKYRLFVAQTARDWGIFSKKEFGELPKYFTREMNRFEIGKKEWNYYRTFLKKDSRNRTYLELEHFNPRHTDNLKDKLSQYNNKIRTPLQFLSQAEELYDRYTMMLNNGMKQALMMPTAGTRYYLQGGWLHKIAPTGSPLSAAWALIGQYKTFPFQLMRQTLSGTATAAFAHHDYMPLINYLTSSLVYNYISWGAKSLLTLRSWPSFSDSKYPYSSFLQNVLAPTFGLIQDVVLTEYKDKGDAMTATLGPTGQSIWTAFSDLTKLTHGDLTKDAGVNFLEQWTPTTLPILGGVLKMVFNDFKSTASQHRSRTAMQNYSGQHYLWS